MPRQNRDQMMEGFRLPIFDFRLNRSPISSIENHKSKIENPLGSSFFISLSGPFDSIQTAKSQHSPGPDPLAAGNSSPASQVGHFAKFEVFPNRQVCPTKSRVVSGGIRGHSVSESDAGRSVGEIVVAKAMLSASNVALCRRRNRQTRRDERFQFDSRTTANVSMLVSMILR